MISIQQIKERFTNAFEEQQAMVLTEVMVEAIWELQMQLVKASDFNELKGIVKELAEAQKRTELKVEELAEAQKRTEIEIRKLTKEVGEIKTELGGLSMSMSYAMENEAYRALPGYLKNLGIELTDKFIRKEINGEEINIFAKGIKDGKNIIIVGESELKLTSISKIKQLERKVSAVSQRYPGEDILKMLIAHFAKPAVMEKAREKGIMVVQSFEWQQ